MDNIKGSLSVDARQESKRALALKNVVLSVLIMPVILFATLF